MNMNKNAFEVMHPETIPTVLMSCDQDAVKVNNFHHRAFMPSALEDYQPLVPLFDAMYRCNSGDTVSLVLNGDGGYVTTAAHISTAIARTQAVVITEAYGRTSSAHTLVLLSGDVILPVQNTLVMSHNMSMGSVGSGEEPIKHVQASLDWCYTLFEEHQLPFLNLEELESIFQYNNTLWFSREDDINNRIYTTMWYRAAMGALKPKAFELFIELFQEGVYDHCELTNLGTLLQGLQALDEGHVDTPSDCWIFMEKAGMFGDHNNPLDFVLSLES